MGEKNVNFTNCENELVIPQGLELCQRGTIRHCILNALGHPI
jgi:hypothetical protein